jgi:hypothetical protein
LVIHLGKIWIVLATGAVAYLGQILGGTVGGVTGVFVGIVVALGLLIAWGARRPRK